MTEFGIERRDSEAEFDALMAPQWIFEGDPLPEEIAEAARENPSVESMGEWLRWWSKAERFRLAVLFVQGRLDEVSRALADSDTEAVLGYCSNPPSVATVGAVFKGLDYGLVTEWQRWCESELLPSVKVDLLNRAMIDQLPNRAAVGSGAAAFAVHSEWGTLSSAFVRLGEQSRANAGMQLRGQLGPDAKRNREWCEKGLRLSEALLYSGSEQDDPGKILEGIKRVLLGQLAEEFTLKSKGEREDEDLFAVLEYGEVHGISAQRVIGECKSETAKRGISLLQLRSKNRTSERLSFARDRLQEMQSADRSPGGRVTFVSFNEGVGAFAEAISLGATLQPDLTTGYQEWRDGFRKLERLRSVSLEADKYCQVVRGRERTIKKESGVDLEKRLEEIKVKGENQRGQFFSTKGNLVSRDGMTRSDIGENSYLPAKRLIDREFARRRAQRIRRIAAAFAAILMVWIGIDTYQRASNEADQRIEDFAVLRAEAPIEVAENTLTEISEIPLLDGFFRFLPKWTREVEEDKIWIEKQRRLSDQLVSLNQMLSDFRGEMLPFPGIESEDQWNRALEDWTVTESRFVEARGIIGELAPGVAREEKGEFVKIQEQWLGALENQASSLEGVVGDALKGYEKIYMQGVDKREEPEIDVLTKSFREVADQLRAAGSALEAIGSLSVVLDPIEAVRTRNIESVRARKADADIITAHLSKLLRDLTTLAEASGLPTYVSSLASITAVPAEIEKLLPSGLSMDSKAVQDALAKSNRFEQLVFKDFEALAKWPSDPPVPTEVKDEISSAMIDLQDDWKLKDIYVWKERTNSPVNAYSRGRPTSENQTNGSVMLNLDAYLPQQSDRIAEFRALAALDSTVRGGRSLVGDFPRGKDTLSRESEFFETLNLPLIFNISSGSFKNSLFYVVDKIIAEANRSEKSKPRLNLIMLAYIHQQIGKAITANPEGWGAALTSFPRDLSTLNSLRRDGVSLDLRSDDWMVPGVCLRWNTTLEVYYLSLAERSYVKEYTDNVLVSRSAVGSGSGFEFVGFLEVNNKVRLSKAGLPPGTALWGVREEPITRAYQALPGFETADDGGMVKINRVARLSPLFVSSIEFAKFMETAKFNSVLRGLLRSDQ